MQYEQTRICSIANQTGEYIEHMIWQGETSTVPWAVSVEGYRTREVTIKIYHEDVNRYGIATYQCVRARSAREFAEFVVSQLKTFELFPNVRIEVTPGDIRALYEGYMEGVRNAQARRK